VRRLLTLTALLGAALPSGDGALAVERNGEWITWYEETSAPTHWGAALPVVEDAVTWTVVAPGVEEGRLRLSGPGEAWRVGVVLVRIDPAKSGRPGTEGLFGWDGAASTRFRVDRKEKMVSLLFTQWMPFDPQILNRFETLVYQALVD
jgi:CubicO group peptidase (beta-lactamase class C family)